MKTNLKTTIAMILTTVLIAVSIAVPVSASFWPTTGALMVGVSEIDVKQVEEMQVINRDLHAGYNVTGTVDRTAIVNALNKETLEFTAAEEKTDGLRLLNIRLKDGTRYNYWVHTNVLMVGEQKYVQSKVLTDALDRCEKNYPANIEWLGYMNPYRITKLTIERDGEGTSYQSALSDSNRQTILGIAEKLKNVKVGSVRETQKKDKEVRNGGTPYVLQMEFENGKEGYTVRIDGNAEITVWVDSIDYVLSYTPNDKALMKSLTDALDGMLA